ncbi:MAG: hypothetical protein Q9208_008728 [Pyrenodesmia sp. 3 TL-2023]
MSSSNSPPAINFSGITPESSSNDPSELAKRLAKINFSKPESYGGVLRDPTNTNVTFETFSTHTPPDIPSNTRILAVCGIEQEKAMPELDGWFLSDFMAFWHVLHGFTKYQSWYHCLDLDLLVQQHGRYLYGNPYKQRKVVLDSSVLQETRTAQHGLKRFAATELYSNFARKLKEECKAAQAGGENVLVLVLAHGDQDSVGFFLGATKKAFKKAAFSYAMKGLTTQVTLITTQCYGGGWTCMPALNLSTWAYAAKDVRSASWRKSGSCGRACGSMYTTAIIEQLTLDPATGRSLFDVYDSEDEGAPPKLLTPVQEESYTQLCGSIYECLLKNVDRRGMMHGLSFSAQDDAWSICWTRRTGIPLAAYKKRWDDLEDWEADVTLHPGDPLNRDPNVTAEQEAEYVQLEALAVGKGKGKGKYPSNLGANLGSLQAEGSMSRKRKTSGLYGGTLDGLIETVKVLGAEYLKSNPGNEDTADDGPLHGEISWLLANKKANEEMVEWVLRSIQFRMEQQAAADRYLALMEVPSPQGQSCLDFDERPVREKVGRDKYTALRGLINDRADVLFPPPDEHHGHRFSKGRAYLVAAFHLANLSKDTVIKKLDMLTSIIKYELQQQKEIVKRDPEVQRKRRKLYDSYHIRGDMSPRKRMSISKN